MDDKQHTEAAARVTLRPIASPLPLSMLALAVATFTLWIATRLDQSRTVTPRRPGGADLRRSPAGAQYHLRIPPRRTPNGQAARVGRWR
jgi:hypothetical protein